MSKRDKTRPRTDTDWVALQEEYERTPKTQGMVTRLARKYDCASSSLYARRLRDGWRDLKVAEVNEIALTIKESVKTNVIDIMTKRAYANLGGEAGIDAAANEMAESLAEELLATPRILRKLTAYAENMIDRGMSRELDLGDKAGDHDAFNAILTGASKLMAMVREAHGLTNGIATIGDGQKSKMQRFIFVKPKVTELLGDDAQAV